MSNIIYSSDAQERNVNKYIFKSLANDPEHTDNKVFESVLVDNSIDEESLDEEPNIDASDMSQSSKDALIESLLKKTDEMTSNFIKLQMKLETMGEEHTKELAQVKEASFAEGMEAGKAKALKEHEANLADGLNQFSTSVTTLENSAKEFSSALEGIKKELITAALDIAKEVVNVELSESSTEIATLLSRELIKELQNASKVTLKVNPKDHGTISEKVGSLEHVEVISDSAVSKGGVIAISDAGNIDAEISKRFERVKRAALSE